MNKTINPEMIIIARESRGFTQSELAKELRVSQGQISKIESGILNASDEMLSMLSKKLGYPEDFFQLPEQLYGIGLAFIYHRSRQSLSQKIINKIEAQINIHRIIISKLLRSVEYDVKFPLLDIDEYNGKVEDIAKAVRATWVLPRGPVKNLTQIIENAGGLVIKCDFGTPKIDALSQYIPGLPPMFFINKNIPGDRLRFSLAHEVGHVIMHRIPHPEMEEEADKFAAEFLMPAQEIGAFLHNVNLPKLASLKPYWKVSMAALLKRASDLNKVSERTARYIWMQIGKAGYRLHEPVELNIPIEDPISLKKLVDIYLNKLNYSIIELSKILAIYPHEFRASYLGEEKHLKLVIHKN